MSAGLIATVVIESVTIAGYIGWRVYGWWKDNDRVSNASFERAALAQNPGLAGPPPAYPQQPYPQQPYPQQPYPQQQQRFRQSYERAKQLVYANSDIPRN